MNDRWGREIDYMRIAVTDRCNLRCSYCMPAEGIGPKIASVLGEAGISTFEALSKTDAEKIAEIIKDVRGNHVTTTWPKQAQMAFEGKWDELKVWQDELDGGIEK